METLTHDQFQDLKKEFVDFKINEMTHEDMYAWIRDVYMYELDKCTEDHVKEEIDCYDEHLYDLLVPYVKMRKVHTKSCKSSYTTDTQTIG